MSHRTRTPRTRSIATCCLVAGISLSTGSAVVVAAAPSGAAVAATAVHSVVTAAVQRPMVAAAGAVSAAPRPDGKGFWTVTASGVVSAFGQATNLGDMAGRTINAPVVGIASTPDGNGYWLVASDGGIFSFGDAAFHGSTGSLHLNQPIVGMTSTASGNGYWLVASDGGIFAFGDAAFHGSTGSLHLNRPIVGMTATPSGSGYWLVASDGGIFSFGDAAFHGSTGSMTPTQSIVGMASDGLGGYWLLAANGNVFAFGSAPLYGSAAGALGGSTAVAIIATAGGYWITAQGGAVLSFGSAPGLQGPLQTSSATPVAVTDPAHNVNPTPAFESACYISTPSAACDAQALSLVNQARSGEGLPALSLPANYESVSQTQQLFDLANAERVSRGLPAFSGMTAGLNASAQQGALGLADPVGPGGVAWSSNLAWGLATPLAADFAWMYDDGIGSTNVDCTATSTSGCWGHRRDILVPWGGSMGAAAVSVQGRLALTELFAEQ